MAAGGTLFPRCQEFKLVDYVVAIFYLLYLSITGKGILKSLTMVVDLLVSPSNTVLHSVQFFSGLFSRSLIFPSPVSKPMLKLSFEF